MGSESSAAMQERPQLNSGCILQCLDFVTTGLIGIAALQLRKDFRETLAIQRTAYSKQSGDCEGYRRETTPVNETMSNEGERDYDPRYSGWYRRALRLRMLDF